MLLIKTAKMCCRFVLFLLFMCIADSEARLSQFTDCSQFFYQRQWPLGFENTELKTNYKYICQHFANQDHFASLYMTGYRIPLFSAYRLDTFNCTNTTQNPRLTKWFIEPQLANLTKSPNMSTEAGHKDLKKLQAVNEDYSNTSYDRGHLNPKSYQCDAGRTATYTLTNAVPQDPCFNQHQWKTLEQTAKKIMREKCISPGAKRFFVTGVIPSDMSIPSLRDHEVDQQRDYDRVRVPYSMWTAACCDLSNANKITEGFSFGYYGRNLPDAGIEALSIPDLRQLLNDYGFPEVEIFTDDCFPSSYDSNATLKTLVKAVTKMNVHSFVEMTMQIDPSLKTKQNSDRKALGRLISIIRNSIKY